MKLLRTSLNIEDNFKIRLVKRISDTKLFKNATKDFFNETCHILIELQELFSYIQSTECCSVVQITQSTERYRGVFTLVRPVVRCDVIV